MDAQHLGNTIKRARKQKGWTQAKAADEAGLPKRTYESYERGEIEKPALEKVQSIARALDLARPLGLPSIADIRVPSRSETETGAGERSSTSSETDVAPETGLTTAHVYPAYELRDEEGQTLFRVDVVLRVGPSRLHTVKLGGGQ